MKMKRLQQLSSVYLAVSLVLFLFNVHGTLIICLPMLAILFILTRPLSSYQWGVIDIVVVLLLALDVVSSLYSITPIPARKTIYVSIYLLMSYLLARNNLANAQNAKLFWKIFSFCQIVLLGFVLVSFVIFRKNVFSLGFTEVYYFRYLFKPLGYLDNIWAEIALFMVGYSFFARKCITICMTLAILTVLLTFSRGAYLALFCFIPIILLVFKKYRGRLVAIFLFSFSCVYLFCHKDLVRTIGFNETYSQKVSTDWRIMQTKELWELACERPLSGYGKESYSFVANEIIPKRETDEFANLAPNFPILLFVEKGLLGIISFLLLIFFVFVLVVVQCNSTKNLIIGSILGMVLVKDFTLATLLVTPQTQYLLLVLLACLKTKKTNLYEMNPMVSYGVSSCLVCAFFLCKSWKGGDLPVMMHNSIVGVEKDKNKESYIAELETIKEKIPFDRNIDFILAYQKFKKQNYKQARLFLAKCNPNTPYCKFLKGQYFYKDRKYKHALELMRMAILQKPSLWCTREISTLKDIDNKFYKELENRLLCFKIGRTASPKELSKYGVLLHYMGKERAAKQYLKAAIAKLPNLSAPWRLLGKQQVASFLDTGSISARMSSVSSKDETVLTLFISEYKVKANLWYLLDMQ